MRKLVKSVDVNASVERVYELLTTPTNLPSIWPSLEAVGNVDRRADGGHSFDWTFRMAGIRFHGRMRTLEAVQNERFVSHSDEGIKSTFRWVFERKGGASTHVGVEVEYSMPLGLLGRITEAIVAKMNERDLEVLLANAKKALEAPQRARAVAPAPMH